MMNKVAIEACLRVVVAKIDEAWALIRADAHEWQDARVQTLSDSLEVPRLEPASKTTTKKGIPRYSSPPPDPKATRLVRKPETLVLCTCCGEGLLASTEMDLWARKTEHPKVR